MNGSLWTAVCNSACARADCHESVKILHVVTKYCHEQRLDKATGENISYLQLHIWAECIHNRNKETFNCMNNVVYTDFRKAQILPVRYSFNAMATIVF